MLEKVKNSLGTILYIDDNQSNLDLIRTLLHRKDYTCITAQNGSDGIKEIATAKPDLIFIDILMPEMNGFEVLDYFRQDPNLVDVPIIAITATTSPGFRQSCLDAGFSDYLAKPILRIELYDALQKHLKT